MLLLVEGEHRKEKIPLPLPTLFSSPWVWLHQMEVHHSHKQTGALQGKVSLWLHQLEEQHSHKQTGALQGKVSLWLHQLEEQHSNKQTGARQGKVSLCARITSL